MTNKLGVNKVVNKAAERKEAIWKRRFQNKIKELRIDLKSDFNPPKRNYSISCNERPLKMMKMIFISS